MSILVCSSKHGGCGYVGEGKKWKDEENPLYEDADIINCPKCGEDHALQITKENFKDLVDNSNKIKVEELIKKGEVLS